LERAWGLVRANDGAAGIDKQTIADVEEYGIAKLLDELTVDLKDASWRPLPARRVFIPKPGKQELRPLSIPTVTSYPKVAQRVFGFVGRHASVSPACR
jgi:RNA-directed DNA polymerase